MSRVMTEAIFNAHSCAFRDVRKKYQPIMRLKKRQTQLDIRRKSDYRLMLTGRKKD